MKQAAAIASLVLTMVTAAPASAQPGFGFDLGLKSKYVWRGQTLRSGSALQPSVFAFHSWPKTTATVGVFSHIEPSRVDRGAAVGYDRILGEVNLWADVNRELGPVIVNGGLVSYFPRDGQAVGPARGRESTHELYAGARLSYPRVSPHLVVWHDVDAVRGTFLEIGLQYRAPLWTQVLIPVGSLTLSGTAGFSMGQEFNEDDLGELSYFADSGFSYANFSIQSVIGYFPIGPTNNAVHLELHVQINSDPILEQVSRRVDAGHRAKLWLGLTWSVLGPRCRPDREICAN